MLELRKYSIGTGDRFGMQAEAQLRAVIDACTEDSAIDIVWNKSYREHSIIASSPESVRIEAERAVDILKWTGNYFIDADHITLDTVKDFIESSDFFTIDVASAIGGRIEDSEKEYFLKRNAAYIGKDPGFIGSEESITKDSLLKIASLYLPAVKEAARIYKYIEERKGRGQFICEVSMDEISAAQKPVELLFILEALGNERIPVGTIAPKFSGKFNKGIDYIGNIENFEREFESDLRVLEFTRTNFDLPQALKLSLHSGSDKFSLYPIINKQIRKYNTGIHVKTAGTTWLEELIGLSLSGDEGLNFVKYVYSAAIKNIEALSAPYSDVIDINKDNLPDPRETLTWDRDKFAATLSHNSSNSQYNSDIRQLMHIAYKFAAERIEEFRELVYQNRETVSACVYNNILERHIKALF